MNSVLKSKPELRFPQFRGAWHNVKLEQLLSEIIDNRGKTPETTSNGIPLIEANVLGNKQLKYHLVKKFVTLNTYNTWFRKHLEAGDVLFTTVGQTGLTSIYDSETRAAIAQNIVGLRTNHRTNSTFLYYLLAENRNNNKFKKIEMIAVQPSIKVSQMVHLIFLVPDKSEQQKIADFLTAVDDKVTAIEKRVELMQKYKKGVMQQIFSQKIRFKDENGNNFPEWERKRLGDIGKFSTSSVDKIIRNGEKMVSLVNYMNVYRHEDISNASRDKLSITSVTDNQYVANNLMLGDILFTPSSETPTDIGHSVVVKEDMHDTVYSYHLVRFRPSSLIDVNYSNYFCNDEKILKQLASYAQGATRFTISLESFKKIKVAIPASIEEQQKIAGFLTDVDDKVSQEESMLKNAKQYKKALLQRMFV